MEKHSFEKPNPFEKKEPSEKSLEDFHQEIQRLKDQALEQKKKGEQYEPHLVEIEVDKLTEDDMRAWQAYQKVTLENISRKDIQDFEGYRASIDFEKEPERKNFIGFLGNRWNILWGKKQLKEMKKKSF